MGNVIKFPEIYFENRKHIYLLDAPFIQIFLDKVTRVASIQYENNEYFTELFIDDSKSCIMRIKCETINDAVLLKDAFRKQIKKLKMNEIKKND